MKTLCTDNELLMSRNHCLMDELQKREEKAIITCHKPASVSGCGGEREHNAPSWLLTTTSEYEVMVMSSHSHHTHTHHTHTPTHLPHTHTHTHTLTHTQITGPQLHKSPRRFFDIFCGTYRDIPVIVKRVRCVEGWGEGLYHLFEKEVLKVRYELERERERWRILAV